MSNRQLEERQERRRDELIAQHLGIGIETLDEHPFELDENASDDGHGYGWHIVWLDTPPPGVSVSGAPRSQWTDLPPFDLDEE